MNREDAPSFTPEESSLTRNAIWLAFAKTSAFILGVVLPVILVRQLSLDEFGVYRQVFLAINTAIAMLPLGFAMSAYYFFPREPQGRGRVVFNVVLFHASIAAMVGLAIVFWPGVLATIFNSPGVLEHEPLVAVAILFLLSSSFFEIVAIANGEMRLAGAIVIASNLVRTSLLVGAAVLFGTVFALLCAAVIQGLLQLAVLIPYLISRFPGMWRWPDWRLMRAQLAYILPLGFSALLWWSQMDLHSYFVSNRFGAAAFAIYSIGCLQVPLWSILLDSVGSVMIPAVSYLQSRNDHRQIVVLTAGMMRKLALLCFPLFLFLLVSGRELIVVLFTERYLESWPVFAISLVLVPLSLISTACDPVFRAYPEHLSFLIKTRLILLVPLLTALWFGTEYFGLVGAISAVVGVNFIERAVVAGKLARILNMSWPDLSLFRDLGRIAVIAGVAAVVTALLQGLAWWTAPLITLVVSVAIYGLTYLFALHVSGILTLQERTAIRDQFLSLRRLGRRGACSAGRF